MNSPADPARRSPGKPAEESPVIDSRALFGGSREIIIEHRGERYVLRVTRQGKLLLNK